jgi:hypothetical protein
MHIIDLTQYTLSQPYQEPEQLCFDFDDSDDIQCADEVEKANDAID